MRLLLDEHFSPEIARQLRDRGHDAVAVKEEAGLIGLPDHVHFASSSQQRRAIVTRNFGDFRPLLAERMRRREPTFGLVCVPRRFLSTRRDIGTLVGALDALLNDHPEEDAIVRRYGGEFWL